MQPVLPQKLSIGSMIAAFNGAGSASPVYPSVPIKPRPKPKKLTEVEEHTHNPISMIIPAYPAVKNHLPLHATVVPVSLPPENPVSRTASSESNFLIEPYLHSCNTKVRILCLGYNFDTDALVIFIYIFMFIGRTKRQCTPC